MLTVISPAKRLDQTPQTLPEGMEPTEPVFAKDADRLARLAKKLSVDDLCDLMHISDALARLNRDRFKAYRAKPAPGATWPAAFLFAGDTYAGLEAPTMDADALRWAQGHLRILSGLYGLLRPLDAIQAYRLEMGSRLANPKGADLYAFWGSKIAKALNAQGAEIGAKVLVNCASAEYFGAVDRKALKLQVITPVFVEDRDGDARIISFFAKKARGAMARFIADHQLTKAEDIRGFDLGGYRHDAARSTADTSVFLRPAAEAKAEAA
jgi:uncharacterized protein